MSEWTENEWKPDYHLFSFGFESNFLQNGEERICFILPRIWHMNGWILIKWYMLVKKQVEMGAILVMGFIKQMITSWTFIYLNKISEIVSIALVKIAELN